MKVRIILPKTWLEKTRYEFLEPVNICGHIIPKGFITDGATVPRFFWPLFPPVGRYFLAAALHDYLLTRFGRKYSDREFLKAMVALSISACIRWTMYGAVRLYSKCISLRKTILEVME